LTTKFKGFRLISDAFCFCNLNQIDNLFQQKINKKV
jgi:hypothetical protein